MLLVTHFLQEASWVLWPPHSAALTPVFGVRWYDLRLCWKAHFSLLNQSLVHFLLNLIDWFSLDGQFWEGEEGAVSLRSSWIAIYWSYCCMGKPNLSQLPCQQSLCWLLKKQRKHWGNTTKKEREKRQEDFYFKWSFQPILCNLQWTFWSLDCKLHCTLI